MDSQLEVSLKEAMTINPAYEIGEKIRFEVTPKRFWPDSCSNSKTGHFATGARGRTDNHLQ